MNQKKKLIIDEAVRLFAQKGYHASSIQEIADQCGISKGSFYSYFKSKEDLIVTASRYYYSLIFEKVTRLDQDSSLSAREIFIEQLTLQMKEFFVHKEFIFMLLSEHKPNVSKQLEDFSLKIRSEVMLWYIKRFKKIYPDLPKKYLYDCVSMLGGMMKEYIFLILMEKRPIDLEAIAPYLMRRMDAIAASFDEKDAPLLKKEMVRELLEVQSRKEMAEKEAIIAEIRTMSRDAAGTEHTRFLQALESIEQELLKKEQNRVILEAMMLLLEQQKKEMPSWKEGISRLLEKLGGLV
ncbi:TetR/AcrR family transcriptional regulator [Metabacillus sp. GX 13764]|uniref:TetR/AcrR family transcriptional regulator n=1 Tax=Metabacillus kandeliae TaxID=2900151 RepID=UPI001E3F8846|nr:TetR/AcrR family transcriptional regulator [Metabacillus kandeliae]MCD7035903.1 TetR/AcrR family transcriptional regulator [Metabacillus kandeliae]